MPAPFTLTKTDRRITLLALIVIVCDQITKWLVLRGIFLGDEITVIPGFFNLTHRVNTGAAWSQFSGHNAVLAIVAIVALALLFRARFHFGAQRLFGQLAFGLVFGGIIGNLTDRILPGRHAVVDFLHFYMARRGAGGVFDFPAFNVADSAICVGVAIIILLNWKEEPRTVTSDK